MPTLVMINKMKRQIIDKRNRIVILEQNYAHVEEGGWGFIEMTHLPPYLFEKRGNEFLICRANSHHPLIGTIES